MQSRKFSSWVLSFEETTTISFSLEIILKLIKLLTYIEYDTHAYLIEFCGMDELKAFL